MITSDVFAALKVDALEIRQLRKRVANVACVKPDERRSREDQRIYWNRRSKKHTKSTHYLLVPSVTDQELPFIFLQFERLILIIPGMESTEMSPNQAALLKTVEEKLGICILGLKMIKNSIEPLIEEQFLMSILIIQGHCWLKWFQAFPEIWSLLWQVRLL